MVGGAIEHCKYAHAICTTPLEALNLVMSLTMLTSHTLLCQLLLILNMEAATLELQKRFQILPDGFTAVIKARLFPALPKHYHISHLKIAYSPEFLVERRRLEDFANQDILVCGTHHKEVAEMVFKQHKDAGVLRNENLFHVTPTQAELVKYTKNTFYAMKVIFANQMYDLCQALDEDWYKIREIITTPQEQPIGESHLDPIFGLNRGFGGKCLPKDSQALAVLAESLDCKYELLEAIQNDNGKLREILTGKPSE